MPQTFTFRLIEVLTEKNPLFNVPAVYIARDGANTVQYIGQTECGVKERWTHHKGDKPGKKARPLYSILNGECDLTEWTLEVIAYKVRKARPYLLKTEKALIQRLQPKLNIERPKL